MKHRDQRGMMVAVETAIILPALLLIVGLLVVLASQALTGMAVSSAAAQAARAASIEREPASAASAAQSVAGASLAESGIACLATSVDVDAGGLRAALGSSTHVSVTVSCEVDFGVGLPGMPLSKVVTATKTSPVDTYRSR
ncbi:TadE/TadG family type IV pilus assembly protein [Tessaracoccus sp. MC1756]|uniref:TadE/TadG family type IV pilus assembly protein n=1 Tax=Tessaracoccus sp. MC1756 TaxID=2760311 RepID=UPI0016003BE1|nr:TadE/TadG family type IV pilus assembly protein [Tessaracoccus sp. MC1756]MBB1510970.1 pilus assembly protein [Tessaracoccus sp. MC1756]